MDYAYKEHYVNEELILGYAREEPHSLTASAKAIKEPCEDKERIKGAQKSFSSAEKVLKIVKA